MFKRKENESFVVDLTENQADDHRRESFGSSVAQKKNTKKKT